jgi:hypothetical protein
VVRSRQRSGTPPARRGAERIRTCLAEFERCEHYGSTPASLQASMSEATIAQCSPPRELSKRAVLRFSAISLMVLLSRSMGDGVGIDLDAAVVAKTGETFPARA